MELRFGDNSSHIYRIETGLRLNRRIGFDVFYRYNYRTDPDALLGESTHQNMAGVRCEI